MVTHVRVGGNWLDTDEVFVRVNGQWMRCKEVYARHEGAWRSVFQDVVTYINVADRTGASIHQLMGSPTRVGRYMFINQATIGATSTAFALRTGTFPAGSTLTVINEGAIQGRSGTSGAAGGAALYADFPFTLDNSQGTIFGGGGGGGVGGVGGGGTYTTTARIPTTGHQYSASAPRTQWLVNVASGAFWSEIVWNGTVLVNRNQNRFLSGTYTVGNMTYHQVLINTSTNPTLAGIYAVRTDTHNSNGGAGGAGGRGQGYGLAAAAGALGAAGGAGAGYGGRGGTGGAWGTAGATGAVGNLGNRTSGLAGTAGGAAGRSIQRNGHAVTIVSGNTTDRIRGPIV